MTAPTAPEPPRGTGLRANDMRLRAAPPGHVPLPQYRMSDLLAGRVRMPSHEHGCLIDTDWPHGRLEVGGIDCVTHGITLGVVSWQ
jgi:hypothetical protein